MTSPGPKEVLSELNSLQLGELSRVDGQLARAREALLELGQEELSGRVEEARTSLKSGDLKEFRRALANVTAKLGHLK